MGKFVTDFENLSATFTLKCASKFEYFWKLAVFSRFTLDTLEFHNIVLVLSPLHRILLISITIYNRLVTTAGAIESLQWHINFINIDDNNISINTKVVSSHYDIDFGYRFCYNKSLTIFILILEGPDRSELLTRSNLTWLGFVSTVPRFE